MFKRVNVEIVVDSKSEEFEETRRLAEHTWVCGRGGKSRVRHSGFHRALCFVMGWRSGRSGNNNGEGGGGKWEMEQLSEEEAASEKEDLIIWPPVVLVHSFPNTSSPISPDLLKDHLQEEGFGGEGGRYGKIGAGEEGWVVVCFSGTLSGFQEAERLEMLLGEKRKIRGDYRYYGKLGVAADIEQVDVELRKRCVVKSKRDILAIAHHTPITSHQYSTL